MAYLPRADRAADVVTLVRYVTNVAGAEGEVCGGRGIRTPGGLAAPAVFKTAPFNRSGIPPVCRSVCHVRSGPSERGDQPGPGLRAAS